MLVRLERDLRCDAMRGFRVGENTRGKISTLFFFLFLLSVTATTETFPLLGRSLTSMMLAMRLRRRRTLAFVPQLAFCSRSRSDVSPSASSNSFNPVQTALHNIDFKPMMMVLSSPEYHQNTHSSGKNE